MLGTYAYHEIFRKTIVGFGTLFNNIELRRQNEVMKVPLAYGPKQKFLARLDQNPDPTNKRVQITLPRISFEIAGMNYDPTRKVSPTQKIKISKDVDENYNTYMPVPYNLDFELAIISKNQDDGLQILEQVLPIFQPHYNLPVKLLSAMKEIKDVPVVLQSIDYEDDYESDFTSRRAIIYTLRFTAKTYLYGPVTEHKIVRKAKVDYYSSTNTTTAPRQVRYTATPEAWTDKDGTVVTTLSANITAATTNIPVASATGVAKWDDLYIGSEQMKVTGITGNTVHVQRGRNGTVAATAVGGANVFKLDAADDALVTADDDFGFNETTSFFQDMKKYNPVSGQDESI